MNQPRRWSNPWKAVTFCLLLLWGCYMNTLHLLRHEMNDEVQLTNRIETSSQQESPLQRSNNEESSDDLLFEDGFVLEQFKLVFFTVPKVGSTTWKMLFRRLLGYRNWHVQNLNLPHRKNGLVRLSRCSPALVRTAMTSPDWTRAIFVRDPLQRFVSAYLDKARQVGYMQRSCCSATEAQRQARSGGVLSSCCPPSPGTNKTVLNKNGLDPTALKCFGKAATSSALKFFQVVASHCHNEHWVPQSFMLRQEYWPYINFVGHAETVETDSERLFRRLGLWDTEWIQSGWGANGTERVFGPKAVVGRRHRQNATGQSRAVLTPALQDALRDYYRHDYQHAYLNFTEPAVATQS